jgi:hypothetical protein
MTAGAAGPTWLFGTAMKAQPSSLHRRTPAGRTLPDAEDRHVLAAAIRCNASVIVTFNEKDVPAQVLATYGIDAQHPEPH